MMIKMKLDDDEMEFIRRALACIEAEWGWNFDEERRNLFEAVWLKFQSSTPTASGDEGQ